MEWVFSTFQRVSFERCVDDLVEVGCEGGSLEGRREEEGFRVTCKGRVRVEEEELVDDGVEFVESNEEEVKLCRKDDL